MLPTRWSSKSTRVSEFAERPQCSSAACAAVGMSQWGRAAWPVLSGYADLRAAAFHAGRCRVRTCSWRHMQSATLTLAPFCWLPPLPRCMHVSIIPCTPWPCRPLLRQGQAGAQPVVLLPRVQLRRRNAQRKLFWLGLFCGLSVISTCYWFVSSMPGKSHHLDQFGLAPCCTTHFSPAAVLPSAGAHPECRPVLLPLRMEGLLGVHVLRQVRWGVLGTLWACCCWMLPGMLPAC